MPQPLRQLLHNLLMALTKFFASFAPASRHAVFAGPGSSGHLCDHIVRTGARRILVVTDKPLRELGVVDAAIARLAAADVEIEIYDGVLPDPTFDHVAAGAKVARAHASEVVLAIGGGSSIDAAKLIVAAATGDGNPADWVGFSKIKHDPLPLFAIPTTSGTGSEATMGGVISDPETHQKSIVAAPSLLPAAAALDPDLIIGLPPHITAATGMDALTHGIEAYIGTWDRGTRKEDARIAVKLVFDHLRRACSDGGDIDARNGVAMGAYYAGLAINQVNVGNVHAIAHQLGGKYGIPHGLANALVLPHILEFSFNEATPELAELALLVGAGSEGESEAELARKFIQAVRELRSDVGIGDTSDKLQRADFDSLCQAAMAEGIGYPSPRLLDRDSTLQILEKVAA
jgi:alcohol dehydrogenase class IV